MRAIERFDQTNAADPRTTLIGDREAPTELAYARRMTRVLDRFEPGASDALRLAVRAQHIARWNIPRSDFPLGRAGYRSWRTRLMDYHAELAGRILQEVGYREVMVERVGQLLRKRGLKRDPEAQTLEDVACLVFLEHHLEEFTAEHDDDKVVDILRKTWAKMSARGRSAALELELGPRGSAILGRALAG
ncbi:MAG: DUF4202 domain-containing protein [Gemmatimonadetes bacterium]|nr:DUF4202 domain-containing protein [Gemmatimonadota bacterium]